MIIHENEQRCLLYMVKREKNKTECLLRLVGLLLQIKGIIHNEVLMLH